MFRKLAAMFYDSFIPLSLFLGGLASVIFNPNGTFWQFVLAVGMGPVVGFIIIITWEYLSGGNKEKKKNVPQ